MFTRNLDCYREATQTICAWLVASSCDNLIVPMEKLRPREGRESQYRVPSAAQSCLTTDSSSPREAGGLAGGSVVKSLPAKQET